MMSLLSVNSMLRPIYIAINTLLVIFLISGCNPVSDSRDEENGTGSLYQLPVRHINNDHPLKNRFFQEAFRDLDGNLIQLNDFAGTPMVICVYSSFKTRDGQKSLLGLESLLAIFKDRFLTIVIPVESIETIEPSIVNASENMLFLFRAGGDGTNLSLVDKYAEFFWNHDIISADFPQDNPQNHYTSPFYWIVDENGVIREKLIDYSDTRGVVIGEVREVLEALLGPNPIDEPVHVSTPPDESTLSIHETESSLSAGEIEGDVE